MQKSYKFYFTLDGDFGQEEYSEIVVANDVDVATEALKSRYLCGMNINDVECIFDTSLNKTLISFKASNGDIYAIKAIDVAVQYAFKNNTGLTFDEELELAIIHFEQNQEELLRFTKTLDFKEVKNKLILIAECKFNLKTDWQNAEFDLLEIEL